MLREMVARGLAEAFSDIDQYVERYAGGNSGGVGSGV
jgi:hypothetical protein